MSIELQRWCCHFRCGRLGTRRHRAGIIEVAAPDEAAAATEAAARIGAKYWWLERPKIESVKLATVVVPEVDTETRP